MLINAGITGLTGPRTLATQAPMCGAATVLGVMPLIQDAFWVSMALTMMVGLTFGTVLTMVLVPTFFVLLYRIRSPKPVAG